MTRMPKFQYVSALLCALVTFPVVAADNVDQNDLPWYQIEVIIFANKNTGAIRSETWPQAPQLHNSDAIELKHPEDAAYNNRKTPNFDAGSGANTPTPYELLDKSQLQLVPVARKLRSSNDYDLLMHVAWRQPTVEPEKATPIYVYDGADLPRGVIQKPKQVAAASKGRFAEIPVGNYTYDSSQYGQIVPVSQTDLEMGPDLTTFSGTLKLGVSRYLHIEVDLKYRKTVIKEEIVPIDPGPTYTEGNSFQRTLALAQAENQNETRIRKREALQTFQLYASRRMRSRELHFIDHPVLGVIVRVIPYEIPKAEPDFDPASQAFTTGQDKSGNNQ
ncbi:MAG: CsiV family protein [Gammaproteobacteria bacterium]